jgi:hypothetical protein
MVYKNRVKSLRGRTKGVGGWGVGGGVKEGEGWRWGGGVGGQEQVRYES